MAIVRIVNNDVSYCRRTAIESRKPIAAATPTVSRDCLRSESSNDRSRLGLEVHDLVQKLIECLVAGHGFVLGPMRSLLTGQAA